MRRRRRRTAVLWGGTTLCLLTAFTFGASARWEVHIRLPAEYMLTLSSGAIFFWENYPVFGGIGRHDLGLFNWNAWCFREQITFGRLNELLLTNVPLYAVFLVASLPTLLVWRFVPKFPCGHCRRCGYNLAGLTEPRCPECGTGFGRDTFEAERCR